MWKVIPIAGATALVYYLLLRHFNVIKVKPNIKAEREYEGLKIGMKREGDVIDVYIHGNFKENEVHLIPGFFTPGFDAKWREKPETIIYSLNRHLLNKYRNYDVCLPLDDPKLTGIFNELYDEMLVPKDPLIKH